MFSVGQHVTVLDLDVPGHMRTPWYVRGACGEIERYCGRFQNPEQLGYGIRPAEKVDLYRVRFKQTELWPDYRGHPDDTLDVEIYGHWLTHQSAAKRG